MALRIINYTLDVSDISPKACQYGGIQGEDNVTDIVFTFSSALVTALNTARESLTLAYRIDATDGAGSYHPSELLTYNGTNNTIIFTLPQDLTSVSGICRLHLIISLLDSNNVEQQILYSYPASIKFSASSYASSPEVAYKREISGALLQAETSATNAATSATAAQSAQTAAETAESNASGYATSAQTSANNAATSATNASDSAGAAATSAGEAANAVSTHNNDSAAHSAAMALKANASDLTAHTSNTANPHGTTKAQVGLGNVDNTSDVNKPVSTAQATAINNAISTAGTNADTKISAHNSSESAHSDIRTSVTNAITTAGTNADAKIITHNTSESAHSDIRDTINLPTATASGTSLALTDLALHKNFVDITVKGATTETGTGTKAPDNPYTISGVTPTKVTVGGTAYPITTSAPLYSLLDGTTDSNNGVTGLETHNIGKTVLNSSDSQGGALCSANWQRVGYTSLYFGSACVGGASISTASSRCSHFANGTWEWSNSPSVGGNFCMTGGTVAYIIIDNTITGIVDGDTDTQKIAKVKAWLVSNNVTIMYKLATPTTIQHIPQVIPQPSLSATITPDYGTVSVTYYRNLASAINLKANMAQEAWITPTLVNSWVNYDTDGTNELAGYFKDTIGFVHLKGRIKSGTIGSTIFTLPAGYRPSKLKYFAISSNNLFGQVSISAAGLVTCTVGSNSSVVLENITFRAEA